MRRVSEIRAIAALSSRNFRLYFVGQCFALTGTWMQRLAMSWLVLEMTRSGSLMGVVEFINQAPVFVLGMFTGVFLDRHDLRSVLIVAQCCTIVHSLALAVLLYLGLMTVPMLLMLSFLLGIITAIDMPARQAGVSQMIEHPSQLQSALSLQSGSFNLARLVGPAIAGFVVKGGEEIARYFGVEVRAIGEIACFALNAVAHTAVLYAFILMRLPQREMAPRSQRPLSALREGFRYSMSSKPIKYCLLFTYAFSFFSMAYVILLPLFAKRVLDGDSRHLGSLLGALGIGALVGVMYMAAKIGARQLPRHIIRMQIAFGILFSIFSQVTDWRISVALMPLVGFSIVSASVASNSLIQSLVEENKRGRVLSLYVLGSLGFGPVGSLLAGHVADAIGAQNCALICGVMALFVGILHAGKLRVYKETVDPILKAKGL